MRLRLPAYFEASKATTQAWLSVHNYFYVADFTCTKTIAVEQLPVKDDACTYTPPDLDENEIGSGFTAAK